MPIAKQLLQHADALHELKKLMGYRDGTICCGNCVHYTATDCSGNPHALPEHCTVNAVLIPVTKIGVCNAHTPKSA